MINQALLDELTDAIHAIQQALDTAVALRDAAPRGSKAPYRRSERRLNRAGDDLINLLNELKELNNA